MLHKVYKNNHFAIFMRKKRAKSHLLNDFICIYNLNTLSLQPFLLQRLYVYAIIYYNNIN